MVLPRTPSSWAQPRRQIRSELLVVLALSFFISAAYAILSITQQLLSEPTFLSSSVTLNTFPAAFDVWTSLYSILGRVAALGPVALVAHFLARTGGGLRDIGFDRRRPRSDVTAALALLAVVAIGNVALRGMAELIGWPLRDLVSVSPEGHLFYIVNLIVISLVAGIHEEVIVAGYMISRLELMGWRPRHALAASAMLRMTYHLYQGVGYAVGHFAFGLLMGWFFQRGRRVMPLVMVHVAIDLIAFVGGRLFLHRLPWLF